MIIIKTINFRKGHGAVDLQVFWKGQCNNVRHNCFNIPLHSSELPWNPVLQLHVKNGSRLMQFWDSLSHESIWSEHSSTSDQRRKERQDLDLKISWTCWQTIKNSWYKAFNTPWQTSLLWWTFTNIWSKRTRNARLDWRFLECVDRPLTNHGTRPYFLSNESIWSENSQTFDERGKETND